MRVYDVEGCYPNMPKETIRFAMRDMLKKLEVFDLGGKYDGVLECSFQSTAIHSDNVHMGGTALGQRATATVDRLGRTAHGHGRSRCGPETNVHDCANYSHRYSYNETHCTRTRARRQIRLPKGQLL